MNLKKKMLSFVTAAVCAVSCAAVVNNGNPEEFTAEAATLTGKDAFGITSEMTIGWNLGNSLDASNTSLSYDAAPKKSVTAWGNPEPTKELIDTVHNAGFNTVRIPTTWFTHIYFDEATNTYKVSDVWMNYVKKVVDWAYDQGMFVILNVHHEDFINVAVFTDDTYATAKQKLTGIWSQVSEVFADYDQHLIFEGMNEPRETGNSSNSEWGDGDQNSWNYINKLNKDFVDTIRGQGSAENKERLLMLPGYHAGASEKTVSAIEIPENSGNVAISTHAYTPYFFAMATDQYANHSFPGKSGYGGDYETELETQFNTLKSISDKKGVPIIMGEFSASDFNNTADRARWAQSYLSKAKAAGIPCVLWDNNVPYNSGVGDNGEAHGYIYRMTNTIYPNSSDVLKSMMDTVGVTDYTLPEYKEYEAPAFSWDNVKIGSDWIELYKNQSGLELKAWKPEKVDNMKKYLNEDYMYAVVYDSTVPPAIVMQTSTGEGGWYYTLLNDDKSVDFTAFYTYDDFMSVLKNSNDSASAISDMYVSAHSGDSKIYGVYAVPANSQQPTEEPTTEPVTEPTTEPITEPITEPTEPTGLVIKGDVTLDHTVTIADVVLLQKYLIKSEAFTDEQFDRADMNDDSRINIFDAVALRRYVALDESAE